MKNFFFTGIALFFFLLATPQKAVAEVELGLTPSNVYGLWTNINAALMALVENTAGDEAWLARISQMQPDKFSGKTPTDVLAEINLFIKETDVLARDESERETEKTFTDEVLFLLREGEGVVTPSLVYMRSGHVLTDMVKQVNSSFKTPRPISPFFIQHKFKDKTLSDVFGLVDLALRRLKQAKVLGHVSPGREKHP